MSSDDTLPANRLSDENSAYLRRHAYQPVDWYPWGEEALKRAAKDDKPILLSIGYASNHWCGKMESESFEDERVAAFMNARFVCVKVDREERPDVDAHYMEALQAITGEAGYPVTLFLTPEGKPFYGGSYYPPEARDGLPAFGSVLNEVAVLWQKKREETLRKSKEIEQDIGRRLDTTPDPEPLSSALLQQAVFTVQSAFDEEHGGFGEPPKFPQAPALEFMLRASSRGVARATKVAELTLKKMALGGIFDQVGGGFHRFSVDRSWQVPHFEKMLYDNAQLARVYTHAWQLVHSPLYRRVALDTLEYLLRDMADPGGAFYSSESSDSAGREGGFYTWAYDELEAIGPSAIEYYGVTRSGNFQGQSVLTAASDDPPGPARAALLKQRGERRRPVRDEKILTSWNGLAIGALAEAGATFDRVDLVEAARRAAGFLLQRHRDAYSGRLYHSYRDDGHKVLGMLEDYAYLAEGLFTLWEVTFEPEWIDACDRLCRQMLDLFWDDEEGGLFSTGSDHEQLIPRRKDYLDPATPSAAAVASTVLRKLAALAGDEELALRSRSILDQAQPNIQGLFLDACAMVAAIELQLAKLTEIAIIGRGGDSRTRALRQQLWDRFLPNKVCAGSPPGIESPLLKGKTLVNDAPAAYVTQGEIMKPPITDPQEFADLVKFWAPPSTSQVGKVTGLISNALQRRHFFDNLKNPAWIQPLKEAGLFKTPPDPIYDYAEETVGSPPWPQSRYLARMAPFSPKEVQQVSLEVAHADNVQVHEDLADVALAVPADLAGSFVAKAKQWLQSPYQLHLPEKLGKLVRRLAEGGRIDEALELTAALLEVRVEENPQAPHAFRLAPEPRARFGKYDYEQILEKDFPALVTAAPLAALESVCDLLESAIELSFRPGEGPAPIDYSYLWRPAIHPTEQNADKTLRDSLVAVLVETAEQIAREQPFLVPRMVELLEKRGRHIFTRTALHLLRVWPEVAPEIILSRLMDRRLFEDPHFHHEYLLLARDHFERLGPEQHRTIFQWIAEGPDFQLWLHDPDSPLPDDESPEGAERYQQRWQLKRLSVLEEYLPEAETATFETLAEAHGADEHADFVIHHAGNRPDPTTPIQAEGLHFNRIEEVLEFLASWKPTPGLGNPTIEGLALKLAQVVATEPAQFGRVARRFKGLNPLYIWAVLQGLREGAEAFTFDWPPVLDLCAWAVEQPIDERDGWRPARLEVARILSRGFTQGNAQTPFDLRQTAWDVLKPLTDDPDPVGGTPPDSPPKTGSEQAVSAGGQPADAPEKSGPQPARPVDASLESVSTVRGEAMHAVIRYALWLRRHMEASAGARNRLREGFDAMPEVREVLERHLDPAVDPSPAIRAVYGRWFAWLLMLDGPWAKARVAEVFPAEKDLETLRDAAWEALISFSPAYDHLLGILGSEYERGVELIGRFDQRAANKVHPENRLAEHLMVFYLRGGLALDEKGLLARFFREAPVTLRRHALGFIGRTLNAQPGQVPRDFELRLRHLWERRVQSVEKAEDPAAHFEELASFGWWFASGKLEDSWSLRQLSKILELGVKLEAATEVIARLKDLAEKHPERAVQCLSLILRSEQDSVSLVAWTEDSRSIINKAMQSGDSTARTLAIELLSFFDVQELEELVRWE
ncbi:MAG: thioredoxin domain-containing protein [Actinomycetota bacterium]